MTTNEANGYVKAWRYAKSCDKRIQLVRMIFKAGGWSALRYLAEKIKRSGRELAREAGIHDSIKYRNNSRRGRKPGNKKPGWREQVRSLKF